MVDYTMVYILTVIVAVIGATFVVRYLRVKQIVSSEDLKVVGQIFNLTTAIISELNLKNEEKIMQISQIVLTSLDYAVKISDTSDTDEILKHAQDETYTLCSDLGIELTESRKVIISQLLQLGLVNNYTKVSKSYIRKKIEVK